MNDRPRTRAELARSLRTDRTTLTWVYQQLWVFVFTPAQRQYYSDRIPLDDYLIWVARKVFGQYRGSRRPKQPGFKLSRKRVLLELRLNPQEFSKEKFQKALGVGANENARIIEFHWDSHQTA